MTPQMLILHKLSPNKYHFGAKGSHLQNKILHNPASIYVITKWYWPAPRFENLQFGDAIITVD